MLILKNNDDFEAYLAVKSSKPSLEELLIHPPEARGPKTEEEQQRD
jgi:hypothetical protein